MQQPHIAEAPSYPVTIHIAGDPFKARVACASFCDKVGLCVTVTDTDYIYSFGSEVGVRVGLINYPRFPKTGPEIEELAYKLAVLLREQLDQQSFTIESPGTTMWFSWREQDVAK
ncbi:hypothetical protein B7L88_gp158 [Rhizobium phage RHEph10]|uniref:hypothetical protein n=1 Tax=Rhizobium phage RHEph10 TaxID=1220717 RepID=UPI0002AB6D28|nr:hypothetical protein B7L88_gp158 [Rhizobium phage RHEph10]AGC36130.1 hypothetical protein RHEph10_gp087 [Rhizobium phage RHEph10]